MGNIDAVIKISKRLESILVDRFGAEGKGLHEKLSSVQDKIPKAVANKIRWIATIRNKLIHEDGYELQNRTEVDIAANYIISELNNISIAYEGDIANNIIKVDSTHSLIKNISTVIFLFSFSWFIFSSYWVYTYKTLNVSNYIIYSEFISFIVFILSAYFRGWYPFIGMVSLFVLILTSYWKAFSMTLPFSKHVNEIVNFYGLTLSMGSVVILFLGMILASTDRYKNRY